MAHERVEKNDELRFVLENAKPNARYGEDVDNKLNSACQYRAVPLAVEK